MSKAVEARIKWVWDNTTTRQSVDLPWRYVARAYSDKGPGWGVWDTMEQRFIDTPELVTIPMEQIKMTVTRQ